MDFSSLLKNSVKNQYFKVDNLANPQLMEFFIVTIIWHNNLIYYNKLVDISQ